MGCSVVVSACGDGGSRPAGEQGDGGQPSEPHITGTAPAAVRGFPSVVQLRPEGDAAESGAVPERFAPDTLLIDQITMAFFPGFLVLRPGQTVEFRNSEVDAAHNVRVTGIDTDSTLFNVGTAQGIPYFHSFEAIGGYHATCDIHPGMDAVLLVTDAPILATADDAGAFSLGPVAPGTYVVRVWSMDPALRSERVVRVGSEPIRMELTGDD